MMKINVSEIAKNSTVAAHEMATYTRAQKDKMLSDMSEALLRSEKEILAANALDIENVIKSNDRDNTFIDRLTLTPQRIAAMCEGIKQIISLPDPVGDVTESRTVKNGLKITKVRAPLGVIAIIYEARPNVTADAAALAIKSGNAVILRGGKDAINSNRAIFSAMKSAIVAGGFAENAISFVDDISRTTTAELLKEDRYIDVVIPRGGEGLKHFILDNSKIPVIASAGGNCHVYVEKTADLEMSKTVVYNAKTQRTSVCNAAETLLVDEAIAEKFLPSCLGHLASLGVEIVGCEKTKQIYPSAALATDEDYATEFLCLKISVKVVSGIDEAITHINTYSTKHTETIMTKDDAAAAEFARKVDSAAIFVNASTRFSDGFELGLGAEMGISTGKLHVRGPIGIKELTSEKYVVYGDGQTRK